MPVHKGVQCDKCGVSPIQGPRYNSQVICQPYVCPSPAGQQLYSAPKHGLRLRASTLVHCNAMLVELAPANCSRLCPLPYIHLMVPTLFTQCSLAPWWSNLWTAE